MTNSNDSLSLLLVYVIHCPKDFFITLLNTWHYIEVRKVRYRKVYKLLSYLVGEIRYIWWRNGGPKNELQCNSENFWRIISQWFKNKWVYVNMNPAKMLFQRKELHLQGSDAK